MKRIYFIIFLAALLRLYHADFPVLGWHSWRQSDTATIARNFYYNGYNIFYPQINWNGSGTGYVESEFQIYPFIVSLFYLPFGISDIFGRVVSIVFSLITIFGIYLLVRKFINQEVALWSGLIYVILPLNIFYGRAFMPESTMLMCSVFSIYFFSEWIDKEKFKFLVLTWIFTSLAILVKLPELYLGLPMLFLAFQKYRSKVFAEYRLWLLAFCILILVFLWYNHAHKLYLESGATFGIWTFGEDKWGTFGLLKNPWFYIDLFLMDLNERHLTYPGFVLFVFGLFMKRKSKREWLFDVWLIAIVIYFLIASHAVRVHEYYQLPFVLPAVVYIGKVLNNLLPINNLRNSLKSISLKAYFGVLCIILICILSYLRLANFMKSEDWNSPVFKIVDKVKSVTNKFDLIISVSNGDPVYLYHCDRNGWIVTPDNITEEYLSEKVNEGAKYIAGEKNKFESSKSKEFLEQVINKYEIKENNNDYFVVRLR